MPQTDYAALLEDEFVAIHQVRSLLKQFKNKPHKTDADIAAIEQLAQAEKSLSALYRQKAIRPISLGNGKLSIGGRPSVHQLHTLKTMGVDIVVTLLRDTEKDVESLGRAIQEEEIAWVWFPLSASALPETPQFLQALAGLFDRLDEALAKGEWVHIHCAAGVHRTGAFTSAFLQRRGYSRLESRRAVQKMREVTAREAVSKHWNWAEKIQGTISLASGDCQDEDE
jgi:protein tyrosine phosphatase